MPAPGARSSEPPGGFRSPGSPNETCPSGVLALVDPRSRGDRQRVRGVPRHARQEVADRLRAGPSATGAGAHARGQACPRARGRELQDARARRVRRANAAGHGAPPPERIVSIPQVPGADAPARRSSDTTAAAPARVHREEPRSPPRSVDPHAHGDPLRRHGGRARGHRVERVARPDRGRPRMARDGREAAAAPPPHRTQARQRLRLQRRSPRREHRGAKRERGWGGAPPGRGGDRRARGDAA